MSELVTPKYRTSIISNDDLSPQTPEFHKYTTGILNNANKENLFAYLSPPQTPMITFPRPSKTNGDVLTSVHTNTNLKSTPASSEEWDDDLAISPPVTAILQTPMRVTATQKSEESDSTTPPYSSPPKTVRFMTPIDLKLTEKSMIGRNIQLSMSTTPSTPDISPPKTTTIITPFDIKQFSRAAESKSHLHSDGTTTKDSTQTNQSPMETDTKSLADKNMDNKYYTEGSEVDNDAIPPTPAVANDVEHVISAANTPSGEPFVHQDQEATDFQVVSAPLLDNTTYVDDTVYIPPNVNVDHSKSRHSLHELDVPTHIDPPKFDLSAATTDLPQSDFGFNQQCDPDYDVDLESEKTLQIPSLHAIAPVAHEECEVDDNPTIIVSSYERTMDTEGENNVPADTSDTEESNTLDYVDEESSEHNTNTLYSQIAQLIESHDYLSALKLFFDTESDFTPGIEIPTTIVPIFVRYQSIPVGLYGYGLTPPQSLDDIKLAFCNANADKIEKALDELTQEGYITHLAGFGWKRNLFPTKA